MPYETHPADRKRQCVFCGTSNTLDFLPLDRTGNRRFVPVMVHPELAEIHILDDEPAARAYLIQVWAEAMEVYRSGNFKLRFSPAMNEYLKVHQRDFMPEDTKAGQIIEYLEKCSDNMVLSLIHIYSGVRILEYIIAKNRVEELTYGYGTVNCFSNSSISTAF